MISHLSIKSRHDRPNEGIWTITNPSELGAVRRGYRMLRRDGASAWTARYVITNTLRIGHFHSGYIPSWERGAA